MEIEIQNAKTTAISILNDMEQKGKEFSQTKSKLDEFYYKIFGNDEIKGLEQELNERHSQLDEYGQNQKAEIEEWKNQIKGLLGSATDASLATSYKEAKDSYNWSIWIWNSVFIISMIAYIAWDSVNEFIGSGVNINETQQIHNAQKVVINYKDILTLTILRLPLYVPLGWLAIFATRRRNEIKRLQEEYKHKEAATKSYSGYKEQIKEIQDSKECEDLIKKLMDNLVEMTSQNPNGNNALKKNKKESAPIFEFLEKIAKSSNEVKNFFKDALNLK